jgi:hypothetical protein
LVKTLKARKAIPQDADALALHESGLGAALSIVSESLSLRRKTLATELLAAIQRHRDELWREHVRQVNWELFDRGVESFT